MPLATSSIHYLENSKLLPKGKQVRQVLEQLDIAIKFEIALNSFHSILIITCCIEVFIIVLLFGFFLRSRGNMWFFLLHLPHLPRAIMSYSISQKVPYA